ncbi:hypothetical protein [Dermatobacter hominis]|uniref:hypothetical protein n=1 Tax=Dermatobacter hominis TaxID=2884263 RepID=UPI001D10AB35|nr:hypothetical protein [Dermatobacter hominis]UDY36734.1 hypothetical protein LH044_04145 [Dermatobacter hominis]
MSSAPTTTLDWPTVLEHIERFVTTEYASVTRAGAPVTWPVTPYAGADRSTIDVATGLTYPLKAERARRDPRVSLSFSFPVGSGITDAPTVLVQGLATVRDADLRHTSSRYLQAAADRFPEQFAGIPTWQLRRMGWYWTRMWVEVTPVRVLWWDGGDLQTAPQEWRAPAGTTAPPSDPAPHGTSSGAWSSKVVDWRARRAGAIERLGAPVITTMSPDGWPQPWRAVEVAETPDGYELVAPTGIEVVDGPAFASFHSHAEVFDGQENIGLAGRVVVGGAGVRMVVDRALADFGVPTSKLGAAVSMMRAGRRLRPRLQREAARRDAVLPSFDELDFRRPAKPRATR